MENDKTFSRSILSPQSNLDHTPGSWFLSELEKFFKDTIKNKLGITLILAKTTRLSHLKKVPPLTEITITVSLEKTQNGFYEIQALFYSKNRIVTKIEVDAKPFFG